VRKEDAIDHAVGVVCLAKRGDRVENGAPLAEIHARDEGSASRAVDEVIAAYSIVDTEPERRPIVLEVLS
jgi:thymidine phosphorylase